MAPYTTMLNTLSISIASDRKKDNIEILTVQTHSTQLFLLHAMTFPLHQSAN